MESEYIGLFNCTCQSDWFSSLLQQLEHPLPNKQFILCNNQSAIHIANGAIMDFKRSHYMNVKYHWVRNQVKENDCLTVKYVPSKENVADIMTKQLNTSLHWDLAVRVRLPWAVSHTNSRILFYHQRYPPVMLCTS